MAAGMTMFRTSLGAINNCDAVFSFATYNFDFQTPTQPSLNFF